MDKMSHWALDYRATDHGDWSILQDAGPVKVTHNLTVCGCCLNYVANNERCHCATANHPDGVGSFRDLPSSVQVVPGDESTYDSFSSVPCDGCGSRLAGERQACGGLTDTREYDDDYPPCQVCGDPSDYCQGHGPIARESLGLEPLEEAREPDPALEPDDWEPMTVWDISHP